MQGNEQVIKKSTYYKEIIPPMMIKTDKKAIGVIFFCFSCILLFPSNLWGWGTGHSFQADLLFEVLPEDVRGFFSTDVDGKENLIKKYVTYPDHCASFDEKILGQEAITILKRYGVKNSFYLHSVRIDGKGPAISFKLLTRAIIDKNREQAALWAGSLMHGIGDDTACNHGPLISYLLRAFEPQKIKMGRGIGLDFGDINTPGGRKIVNSILEGYKSAAISNDPDEVLRKILITSWHNAAFMTQREGRIAATYAPGASAEVIDDGTRAMAELGTETVKQVADLIVTAWQFAREGKDLEITDEIMEASRQEAEKFMQSKPLANDSIYAGLLDNSTGKVSVGVILEPTRKYSWGFFSGGSKYILSAIMRELKNASVPYLPLDIRKIEASSLPSPRKVPVLVVCAGGSEPIPGKVMNAFKSYTGAGGRLMWMGGTRGNHLGELSAALERVPDDMLIVTHRDGYDNLEVINKVSVRFLSKYQELLGKKDYRFIKNPNTPAGWHKPVCNLYIVSANPRIKKLAEVSDGKKTITVAGAWMEKDNRTKYIFLPEYLLAPYLLSGEDTLADPSKPVLDSVGRSLLAASLELLYPDMENLKRFSTGR